MSTSRTGGTIGAAGASNGNGASSRDTPPLPPTPTNHGPPISIVTTCPSSSSSTSNRREQQKMNTPTILLKPPSSSSSSTSQQMMMMTTNNNNNSTNNQAGYQYHHHRYNKNYNNSGSFNHIMTMSTPNASNNNTPPSLPSTNNNKITTEKDDKDIDSALISALNDKRERMSLLRLEQKFIEFMNDKNCLYMDVGGAMNNIVVKGSANATDIECASTPPGTGISGEFDHANNNMNTTGGGDHNNNNNGYSQNIIMHGGMMMVPGIGPDGCNPATNNSIINGKSVEGGRQTSFKRLILHRLADRFNIIRQMHGPNLGPNHIRLVKVPESRIPTVKLIDLEKEDYESPQVPQDRIGVFFDNVTDRLSAAQLLDTNSSGGGGGAAAGSSNNINHGGSSSGGVTSERGKKSKKKERVKIMKRSPNSNSGNTHKSNDSGKDKRRGKKLSDKEKAYAEARARIFNTDVESTSYHSNLDGSEHATNSVTNEKIADKDVPNVFSTTPTVSSPTSTEKNSPNDTPQTSPTSNVEVTTNFDESNDDSNVPAAVKGGAESKVLWRNRQQEASDPDFRRAHHPIMVQPSMYHQQHYDQSSMFVGGGQVGYGGTGGTAGAASGGGYYHQSTTLDLMGYNRNGHHGYYQQHNDISWQQQQDPNLMHQMQHYNSYSSYGYNDGSMTNSQKEKDEKKQQAPVYNEEEFPSLG